MLTEIRKEAYFGLVILPKSRLIARVTLETYVHATEDRKKVEKALFNLLPENLRNHVHIEEQTLAGFYGNEIRFLKIDIIDKKMAQEIAVFISTNMSRRNLEILERTLGLRIDNSGNLYLRVDKQAAYIGKIMLSDSDDIIKIKIHFLPHLRKLDHIVYALRHLGFLPGESVNES